MPFPLLRRLGGELGGLVVAQDRIERGDDANGRFHVMREHFLVHRDAIDALGAEQLRRIEEEALRFHEGHALDWFICVELELSTVSGQRHDEVIAHHTEGDEVHHLGHDGVHLARHDGGARLYRRQIDFRQTRTWPGRQQDEIARDLGELDRKALQRRGIDHESLLIPGGGQHVVRRHDRLSCELGQLGSDALGVALGHVDAGADGRCAHVLAVEGSFPPSRRF